MVPSNPVTSAATDAFLPLILFTTVFAFAITRLPAEERQRLTGFFQALGNAMLVVINWVLWLGPIGVGALAYVVGARAGTSAFGALLHYVAVISSVGDRIVAARGTLRRGSPGGYRCSAICARSVRRRQSRSAPNRRWRACRRCSRRPRSSTCPSRIRA